jgi:hypothetical protein
VVDGREDPNAQDVANALWALATLEADLPPDVARSFVRRVRGTDFDGCELERSQLHQVDADLIHVLTVCSASVHVIHQLIPLISSSFFVILIFPATPPTLLLFSLLLLLSYLPGVVVAAILLY